MEKNQADFIIKQYIKPLYSFSLRKTNDNNKAEELASIIVSQVYASLRSKDDIIDVNAYIYKIARNVYARFYSDIKTQQGNLDIEELNLDSGKYTEDSYDKSEECRLLRREIAYLSAQRRKIVIAYFYQHKKIAEIANEFNMSEGTVKWHLFECKKELKKGMENIRNIGNLGLSPIKFGRMGHNGYPGAKGDTSFFLAKSIAQNVAYACYHEPRTINEIADELGVSPIFIADEVAELTEYGFMDKLPGNRYQTNFVITPYAKELDDEITQIYKTHGKLMVEKYFAKLFYCQKEVEALPIYYTDKDYNFFLWSAIVYMSEKLHFNELVKIAYDELAIHRPDGGYYIAYANMASTDEDCGCSEADLYKVMGYMIHDEGNLRGLKLGVYWNGVPLDWRTNKAEDYKLMYHFLKGNLPQDDRNIDSYETLIEKGYLTKTDDGFKANIVYVPDSATVDALDAILPKPDKEILDIAKSLDEQIYKLKAIGQPKHMLKTIKYNCQNSLSRVHVYAMKHMLDIGALKLPTEEQRKQICNILTIKA